MNGKRIVLGVGIILAILAVFTANAAADNVIFFDPDPSCAEPGETIHVGLWINCTDGVAAWNDDIHYDPEVLNITNAEPGDVYTQMWSFFPYWDQGFVRIGSWSYDYMDHTGLMLLANLTIVAINPGTSTLYHDNYAIGNWEGHEWDATWINGTFTCLAPQETFSKELVEGWNLISLPLTADNMTVSSVFSSVAGKYDAIYRYDAETHNWVALGADDTLENGVGYFIHMTENGTWTYQGSAYTAMSIPLEPGLNLVGWVNTSASLPDALSSIEGDYWYVARWNATTQKFEVYVPDAPPVFNDFNTMERGEGYFIAAKTSCTLTYP